MRWLCSISLVLCVPIAPTQLPLYIRHYWFRPDIATTVEGVLKMGWHFQEKPFFVYAKMSQRRRWLPERLVQNEHPMLPVRRLDLLDLFERRTYGERL